jgi:hypothetical protein
MRLRKRFFSGKNSPPDTDIEGVALRAGVVASESNLLAHITVSFRLLAATSSIRSIDV